MNADLKNINGETFKTTRVTDNMSPRYAITAPLDKLGLRADQELPHGAVRSADGKKVMQEEVVVVVAEEEEGHCDVTAVASDVTV